jgi:hypothetical protein
MLGASMVIALQVTDAHEASDTLDEPLAITAGNSAPTATIDAPLPSATFKVGQEISFSGKASDGEDGALPASALSWAFDFSSREAATATNRPQLQLTYSAP